MRKRNIVIIIAILVIILVIVFFRNKKNLSYQLEEVKEIDYMLFSENNKFGVINKQGQVVVHAVYDEVQIPNPSKPLFICLYGYDSDKNQYKIKVLNEKSEQILYQYVYVEAIKINPVLNDIPYEKSVLKYMQGGKYGLIDFHGNVIIKAQFDEIEGLDYREGLLLVRKNGKLGIININGVTVVKCKYDTIESDGYYEEGANYNKSGFIVGNKKDKGYEYGYLNSCGEQVLPNKYEQIERITNTKKDDDIYLVAFENGKAGFYINKKNIIKNNYEDIAYDMNNDCFVLQADSKQGVSDLEGNIVVDIQYDSLFISGKYINAQKNGQVDIYNYDNKQKINYENIAGLNQTTNDKYSIAITKDDKYKILDIQNNQIKENEYDYLEYMYDDFFIASSDKKYGIVDANGNEIIEIKYDFIQQIQNTKLLQALLLNENVTDLIVGNHIVSTMENCDISVKDNYIVQQSNNDIKYIDYNGNILKNTQILQSELCAYEQNGKWGFVSKSEEIVINPEYDFVTEFNEYGFAGIMLNGKWGVINLNGEVILEPTYIINFNNPKFVGKYYEYNLGYGNPYYVCENVL